MLRSEPRSDQALRRASAVNAIDLDLPEGGVAGFVGPNGAGKSATIRMLLGLITPTSGDGEVLRHPSAGLLPTSIGSVR